MILIPTDLIKIDILIIRLNQYTPLLVHTCA